MAERVKVGLVQINNSFSGQSYLPYSVGILQAYALKYLSNPSDFEFLLPIYDRVPPEVAVEQLKIADIVFFSTYVWNIRISLEIAKQLKAARPDVVVVMGGPQIPDRGLVFVEQNRCVDLVCHGEGEATFVEVLERGIDRARSGDWGELASTTYLREGAPVTFAKRDRIKELGDVPSPYLEGVFDPLIASAPGVKWIALWETNRGCPFACTFCDWGSAVASKVYRFDLDRLFAEIDWFASHQIEYVFCADANFGILPRDLDIAEYAAKVRLETGYPQGLSVQNTKNATDRAYQVQKILSDAGLNKGVTLSLQSIDETTLKEIKRDNISSDTYQELQRRFTSDGVETYTDFILGLPGETYESFLAGTSEIVANGQHNRIQFNNLSILPNAEMGDPAYQERNGMVIVESEVVNIHGSLQSSDNEILERQELVVGTASCPEPDWVRTRATAWTCQFYYFNKVLQIPLLLLHEQFSIPFRDLIRVFTEGSLDRYPTLSELHQRFLAKAEDIQRGGAEYCPSTTFLDIWWPADELALIELVHGGRISSFYDEAQSALLDWLAAQDLLVPERIIQDAIALNAELLKRPFATEDVVVRAEYNVREAYEAGKLGQSLPLVEGDYEYRIDRSSHVWDSWDDWCREVIWWGNKKGAYLYGVKEHEPQISGHF
ncbi:MAG: hypothetical protein CME19_18280 [Gemmatimonadetes bacterium]|nr:hypothetical protein [Gemmatimonadota bacterium]